MTLQQLKYAIEIATWGSINEAAKRNNKELKEIEKMLSTSLAYK